MPSGIMGPRLFLRRDGNMLLPFPWFSGVRSGGRDTFIEVQDEIEISRSLRRACRTHEFSIITAQRIGMFPAVPGEFITG